jgi:hypothetical protein
MYNYHKITAMMTHRTLILLICQSSLKIKIAWIINQQCFINKCIFLLILWIFSSSCNKVEIIRWYFTLFFTYNYLWNQYLSLLEFLILIPVYGEVHSVTTLCDQVCQLFVAGVLLVHKDEIIRWYFTLFFRSNHSTVPLLELMSKCNVE